MVFLGCWSLPGPVSGSFLERSGERAGPARAVSRRAVSGRAARAATFGLLLVSPLFAAPADTATIVWRGTSTSVGFAGVNEFRVTDVARALGFEVATDPATNVLTISGSGHQIFVGAGTSQVPVDQRIVPISRPARLVTGQLYAPADFFEKALFPLVGATGSYDSAARVWTLSEGPAALSLEIAVVHVDPTTQVVFKQSSPGQFVPTLTESGFQIRWPGRRLLTAFTEKRFEDPFVSSIRFAGDVATIEFREKGLAARSYPLTSPDRVVVEVGRAPAGAPPAAPLPAAPQPGLAIVVDPGHGGAETGAIGPGGLAEKQVTLEIGRRLAAALPRALACRVVLTRDADTAVGLDDRTAIANHEKADLFLSLHANSSRVTGARGSETYYLSLEASDRLAAEVASQENQPGASATPGAAARRDLDFILWDLAQSAHLKESSELAETIQKELNALSGTENRGIKQAPFRVLVGATMPAVLVEAAFISNSDEEKKLGSSAFQESVADAIAKAVASFFARRRGVAAPAAAPTPIPTRSP
jgi:N-acetylmuramoyl-L-alanine amidase